MRTFSSVGLALVATTIVALPAGAQRHSRRTWATPSVPPGASTLPVSSPRSACTDDCGDFRLAVVSAVLPSETPSSGTEYITIVVENRGRVASPASVVMVSPRNHLSLVRQSGLRSLAPGERASVQLPVEIAPDGSPCVSITIRSAPIAPVANPTFLAAARVPPAPPASILRNMLPDAIQWAGADDRGFVSPFEALTIPEDASSLDVA